MEARMVYMKWQRNKLLSNDEMSYLKSIREDDELIEELFGSDITFGTSGVCGVVGVGTSKMNNYQVARATQAFSNDLIRKAGGRVGNGIAVAFDTRETSAQFSDTVVRVLLGNGIGVARFLGPRSAPQLSFAIRHLGLEGGIMVTAGHNPKEYNGFKIYNKHGVQMMPEDIKTVAKEFRNIKEFSQIHPYVGYLRLNSIHQKIGLSNDYKFRNAVAQASVCNDVDFETPIVYSPLHGTGAGCVDELLKDKGFKKVYLVKEQMKADGEFSTVETPNPEDPNAFKMGIELAKEKDAEMVLLTDPTCDKVGVAVKDKSGDYRILTGNQCGALLADFVIKCGKELSENPLMIQTVVSGALGKEIAEKAGVTVKETLPGFKYIGDIMNQCDESGEYNFVFGYDESGGALSGTHVREKDGVNVCMLFAEMAGCYKKKGTSILERLEELYGEFGTSKDSIESVQFEGIDSEEKMEAVMENVRNGAVTDPSGETAAMTDYLNDETGLPKENVVKFTFADDSYVAVIPSGTESKIEIYYFVKGDSFEAAEERKAAIAESVNKVIGA